MWTHYRQTTLKIAFSQPKGCENARSVHKVTDFVDRHYIYVVDSYKDQGFSSERLA